MIERSSSNNNRIIVALQLYMEIWNQATYYVTFQAGGGYVTLWGMSSWHTLGLFLCLSVIVHHLIHSSIL